MSYSNNKKKTTKKFLHSTAATTKKPTKPDLKMMKSSHPVDSSSSSSSQQHHHRSKQQISKLALDSLQSKNKNSDFAAGRTTDNHDYLDRLNDNQAHSESDDDYNDYGDEDDEDDEGSIHPLTSDQDPNVLLHELTNKSKNNHKNSAPTHHDVSHFSASQQSPVTRKTNQHHHADDNANHPPVPLPGPPKAVQAVIVKPRFITINWLEPEENPDEVVSYTVYYSALGNDARYEYDYANFHHGIRHFYRTHYITF